MKKPSRTLLTALMAGNFLEYFDFFIFAHFSFLLAPKFYPSMGPLEDAIISGLFFAVGFLARPLGGYIFGKLSDFHGRRKSLMFSVLGMAIPTLCIGLLPTYAEVGLAAPIALVTCRIIQGLCVGGEFTNGGILLIEAYGWNKAGTVAGLYNSAAGTGSLLAIACVAVVTRSGMPEWSWRVPFIIAALLGIGACYLRKFVQESPAFLEEKLHHNPEEFSLFASKSRSHFIKAFTVGAIAGVFIWIPLSYTSFYMTKILGMPLYEASKMTVLAVITHNVLTAAMGWLSDRTGWNNMLLAACAFQLLMIFPSFWLLDNSYFALFQIIMAVPAAMAYAVVHPISAYKVPTLLRGRLSGFAFSAGLSIFAGLTPLITSTLTQIMNGSLMGVASYVLAVCSIGGLIMHRILKEQPMPLEHKLRMVA